MREPGTDLAWASAGTRSMRAWKAFAVGSVAGAIALAALPARANKPADDFLNPQPNGTSLKLFGFWGPGLRATLDNRLPIEQDMSELHSYLIGDVNFAYSEVSANADA